MMRERLIELLNYISCKAECCSALDGGRCGDLDKLDRCQIEAIADYLLADGWIRPPCKVGDTVYVINDWEVEETTVLSIKIESTDSHWITSVKAKIIDHGIKFKEGHWYMFKTFVFGKTVFLTREAAEEALKKGIK